MGELRKRSRHFDPAQAATWAMQRFHTVFHAASKLLATPRRRSWPRLNRTPVLLATSPTMNCRPPEICSTGALRLDSDDPDGGRPRGGWLGESSRRTATTIGRLSGGYVYDRYFNSPQPRSVSMIPTPLPRSAHAWTVPQSAPVMQAAGKLRRCASR